MPTKLFQKGQSGNPAGKPKGPNKKTAAVKELAGEHTSEAVATLVRIMNDKDAPHAAQVAAARELLDRAVGRPSQAIATTIEKTDLKDLTDDELIAIIHGERVAADAPEGSGELN